MMERLDRVRGSVLDLDGACSGWGSVVQPSPRSISCPYGIVMGILKEVEVREAVAHDRTWS